MGGIRTSEVVTNDGIVAENHGYADESVGEACV